VEPTTTTEKVWRGRGGLVLEFYILSRM